MQTSINKMYRQLSASNTHPGRNVGGYAFIDQSKFNISLTLYSGNTVPNPGGIDENIITEKNRFIKSDNESNLNSLLEKYTQSVSFGDLTTRVQSISLPDISLTMDAIPSMGVGKTPMTSQDGMLMGGADNTFSIDVLSTEDLFIERFFGTWLEDTTSTHWKYKDYPFDRGDMVVSFHRSDRNSSDTGDGWVIMNIVLKNVYPIAIDTVNAAHKFEFKPTRQVKFAFDYFTIECGVAPNMGAPNLPGTPVPLTGELFAESSQQIAERRGRSFLS